MDTKLFVFSRKEVALIFFIVLSLSLTFFALGVQFGKRYAEGIAGITEQDRQEVILKSVEEEKVNALENSEESEEDSDGVAGEKDLMHEQLKQKIIEELDDKRVQAKSVTVDGENDIISNVKKEQALDEDKKDQLEAVEDKLPAKDNYSGKYSIQLGSYRTLKEAEDFANGFKIRGYNPIVNEVQIQTTGTWYRVSLGVFDTVSDAKEYVLKEKSLFEGQDYLFVPFD